MKHLLSTTALALAMTLAVSGMAFADDNADANGDYKHHFMHEALAKLPEKDAAQFRDTMKQSHEKDKALHEKVHALHKELHDILTADNFDKSAFIAKSKELQKLHAKMHEHMTEAFANALSKLPQDERQTLADAMHHEHKHHGDKSDDKASDSAQ